MSITPEQKLQIKQVLSISRMSTYEHAVLSDVAFSDALELYAWNAQISAAMLAPLHICEVSIRNAVAEAIQCQYGDLWPWSTGFERSLPNSGRYNSKQDLFNARNNQRTIGKVIPELKFVFWQKMFTGRFDQRLWHNHLDQVLPNLDVTLVLGSKRQKVFTELEQVRKLRNRIAHHEPIFNRNLQEDFDVITKLIRARCNHTADWMLQHQQVTVLLNVRP